jgi:hypothetical protein
VGTANPEDAGVAEPNAAEDAAPNAGAGPPPKFGADAAPKTGAAEEPNDGAAGAPKDGAVLAPDAGAEPDAPLVDCPNENPVLAPVPKLKEAISTRRIRPLSECASGFLRTARVG